MGDSIFNYGSLFSQALNRVKTIRDPHAARSDVSDLKWDIVQKNALFNFYDSDYNKYSEVLKAAHDISISCLNFIITKLLELYKYDYKCVETPSKNKNLSQVKMTVVDKRNGVLLFFKDIEETAFWKLKNRESKEVQSIIDSNGCKECKYIYYMLDHAYLQVIGHNNDELDPGRGYNLFSLKWFFIEYFNEEEYNSFITALNKYLCDVKNYLGYILVKSLTPNTLINFRRVVSHSVLKFDYSGVLQKKIKRHFKNRISEYYLDVVEYHKIRKQFLNDGYYSIVLGSHDFAESFITAEWMYSSMKKARAIDLTVIGTGYFKTVEQLLWELICLHKNEGNRFVKKANSDKEELPLTDENISADVLDSSIGSMALFYKKNQDVFRNELSWKAKKYLIETIFEYRNIRNGYFHKHNIHDWDRIDAIRTASIYIIFLLLGSFYFSENDKTFIGFSSPSGLSDYYQLCEYFNYHSNEPFVMITKEGRESIFIACPDMGIKILDNGAVTYSGLYIKVPDKKSPVFRVKEDGLPAEIYLAKFLFKQTELVDVSIPKVKKIYENGKYVGPSIIDEEPLDY